MSSQPTAGVTEADVLKALPPPGSFLREFVEYAAFCTDAPAAYHLAAGLAILAQTAPIDFCIPYGTPMYSNIFAINVGASSANRKSASINVGRKLLEKALPRALGEVPGSKENLVDSLKENPRQLIIYPEFGSFLAQAERGYLNPLKTAYTEAWDGTPLGRGLVKKKDTEAKTPRLTLLAGSTLEYLERHTEPADWTGGFMARWLTFYADRERNFSVPPGWPSKEPQLVQWIQNLEAYGQFGVPRGVCRGLADGPFDAAARKRWDEWYGFMGEYHAQSTEETAGAISRSHSHALRIAMLLAWDFGRARYEGDWCITLEELEPAIRIVELHLRSVLRIGQNLASSTDMRHRRAVLASIPLELGPDGEPHPKPVSLGTIVRQSRLLKRRTNEIIETLMEEGVIKQHSGVDVSGAWYIRTTREEQENHGRPKGQSFATVGVSFDPPRLTEEQGAQVIQLAPYLVTAAVTQESNGSGTVNTSSEGTSFDVAVAGPDGGITFD